jgi:hypothetical protein
MTENQSAARLAHMPEDDRLQVLGLGGEPFQDALGHLNLSHAASMTNYIDGGACSLGKGNGDRLT